MTIRIGGKTYSLPTGAGALERLLAKVLGLEMLPVQLWNHLVDEAFVSGAVTPPDPRGVMDGLRESRAFLHAHPELAREHSPREVDAKVATPPGLVSDADQARAQFFSAYLADLARSRQDVRDLRKRLFKGKALPPTRAGAFLTSDATRFLDPDFFEALGIPLTQHRTQVLKPNGRPAPSWGPDAILRILWDGGSHDVKYKREWYEGVSHSNRQIAIPAKRGAAILRSIGENSTLDQVRTLSIELARAYPWGEHEAVWFLLTDVHPQLGPIRASLRARSSFAFEEGRITLVIEPWVAADTVYAVYHHLQQEHFGPTTRPFGPEKLRLYKFVEPRRRKSKKKPTWDALTLEWNSARRGQAYDDFRPFRKDYQRVARWVETQVLLPGYKLFAKATPPLEAAQRPVSSGRSRARRAIRKPAKS